MKRWHDFPLARAALLACIGLLAACSSNNIVADVVNSPLNAGGHVAGAPTALNVYLQSPDVQGIDFMDPAVVGYGIPAGGRIEVEMAGGFRRIPGRRINQKAMMVVTGTPQQGMPGKKVGYKISQGKNANTYVIKPTKPGGLPAEQLMSPTPGAKQDAIRQRGIKVFHIGFLAPPFRNTSGKGTIHVRIYDDDGDIVHQGSGTVAFEQFQHQRSLGVFRHPSKGTPPAPAQSVLVRVPTLEEDVGREHARRFDEGGVVQQYQRLQRRVGP